MKITSRKLNALEAGIREAFEGKWKVYAEVGNRYFARQGEEPLEWGVNWACYGTVEPSEAVEFAAVVGKIAKLADKLTKMKLEEDWETEDGMDHAKYCAMVYRFMDAIEQEDEEEIKNIIMEV